MSDPIAVMLPVALVFLLAGLVKGVIGLGLPTVAMGLLTLLMAPVQAAAMLVMPSLVTNVWQMVAGPALPGLLRRLWPMLAGICLGTLLGIGMLAGSNTATVSALLGSALVAYAGLALWAPQLKTPPRAEAWVSPVVGITTGLLTGATGVFVLPAVPYLQTLEMERSELIQALGLSFTVSTLVLALGLAGADAFGGAMLGVSALAVLPALLGMAAGQWLRNRISAATFRRCFFLGLLALGVHLSIAALR